MSKPFEKMMEDEYDVEFVDVTPKENTDLREQIDAILPNKLTYTHQQWLEAKDAIEKLVHQARVDAVEEELKTIITTAEGEFIHGINVAEDDGAGGLNYGADVRYLRHRLAQIKELESKEEAE